MWWILALLAVWIVLACAVALILGRGVRNADEKEGTQ